MELVERAGIGRVRHLTDSGGDVVWPGEIACVSNRGGHSAAVGHLHADADTNANSNSDADANANADANADTHADADDM
jgi:hypothetical protein